MFQKSEMYASELSLVEEMVSLNKEMSVVKKARRSWRGLRCRVVVISALCVMPWPAAQSSADEPYVSDHALCERVQLDHRILATASGAWGTGSDGQRLVVVDTYREDVLEVAPGGNLIMSKGPEKALKGSPAIAKIDLTGFKPSKIQAYRNDLLVQDIGQGRIFSLAKGDSAVDLSYHGKLGNEGTIVRMFNWTPIDGPPGNGGPDLAFAGFVQLLGPENQQLSAFVTFDSSMQGSVVRDYDFREPISFRNRYLEFPLFASVNGKAYTLFLEGKKETEVRLGEISYGSTEPRWLENFPEALREIIEVQRDPAMIRAGRGPELATLSLQDFEDSASLAGIYGFDGRLFVLFKEARVNSQTAWWLYKINMTDGRIDTTDGQAFARYRVPSSGAHLMVVPGKTWAFVEKGPVEGISDWKAPFQEIESVTFAEMSSFSKMRGQQAAFCVRSASGTTVLAQKGPR